MGTLGGKLWGEGMRDQYHLNIHGSLVWSAQVVTTWCSPRANVVPAQEGGGRHTNIQVHECVAQLLHHRFAQRKPIVR